MVDTFALIAQHFEVVAVVSKPDAKVGRGQILTPTPVSRWAGQQSLPLLKPTRASQLEKMLKSFDFDLLLTFAYGFWLPDSVLKMGRLKPLNIHASLLPLYRGPSPVHYALADGADQTGITLVEMVRQIDSGPIYFQAKTKLSQQDNLASALSKLVSLTNAKIVDWLEKVATGQVKSRPQDHAIASQTRKIDQHFRVLSPELTIKQSLNRIRALSPSPGALFKTGETVIKIFRACPSKIKDAPVINCEDGVLFACDWQVPSRKRQTRQC